MAPLVVDPCGYLKPHHSVGHCRATTGGTTASYGNSPLELWKAGLGVGRHVV